MAINASVAVTKYAKGELVHCSAEFTAYIDGVLTFVDPTNVYFKYKKPGLATVTLQYNTDIELVKSAVGKYYVDLDVNVHGRWYYKFYSTGTYQSASETEEFEVLADKI
jgi:hypothetical protein